MRERLWMLSTWILVKHVTLAHNILLENPAAYGLDKYMAQWLKNCLDVRLRVTVNGVQFT